MSIRLVPILSSYVGKIEYVYRLFTPSKKKLSRLLLKLELLLSKMTSIQLDKSSKYDWTEHVYSIVRNNSGRVTGKQLEREIGSKYEVRYAIARLTKEGRIRRIRGFGVDRVEFFYQVTDVHTLEP